jgi:hypothetical protein
MHLSRLVFSGLRQLLGRYRFLLKGYKLGADPGKNTSSNNFYNNVMANRSVFLQPGNSEIPETHLFSLVDSGNIEPRWIQE